MDHPVYLQRRRKLDRPTLDHDIIEITEVMVTKLKEYPEFNMIVGVELSRYCYLEGYPERGARLPTVNPDSQGEGKRGRCNGYIVTDEPSDWHRIDELVEPARIPSDVADRQYARSMGHAMPLDTWKDPEGGLWLCNEATEKEAQFSLESWVRQHRTTSQPPPAGWTLFTRPCST